MSTQDIKSKALQLGYTACSIIPSITFDEYKQYLDERILSFPESKALYERMYKFVTPPESAKSIIVCVLGYSKFKTPDSLNGVIGRYYLPSIHMHQSKADFEEYLTTSGINVIKCRIPDRWAAAKAGLGKFGRNTFIFSSEHGSYIRIDTWVVDKELEYDAISTNTFLSECNDNCQKCVRSCPTKALSGSSSMDRGKCIAHLSYYAKDILDESTRSQMGQWLYGCDICQDVCPLNRNKLTEAEEIPQLSELEEYLKLENILEMDEYTYINIIYPRFGSAGKDGLWLWKSNALRSMINSGDSVYFPFIRQYCNHTDLRLMKIAESGCNKLNI